jgi:hypothetical protein
VVKAGLFYNDLQTLGENPMRKQCLLLLGLLSACTLAVSASPPSEASITAARHAVNT